MYIHMNKESELERMAGDTFQRKGMCICVHHMQTSVVNSI